MLAQSGGGGYVHSSAEKRDTSPAVDSMKEPFEQPRLTYVEPKLVEIGSVADLTKQGFFGAFYP